MDQQKKSVNLRLMCPCVPNCWTSFLACVWWCSAIRFEDDDDDDDDVDYVTDEPVWLIVSVVIVSCVIEVNEDFG